LEEGRWAAFKPAPATLWLADLERAGHISGMSHAGVSFKNLNLVRDAEY
jgi:hypothetical protein